MPVASPLQVPLRALLALTVLGLTACGNDERSTARSAAALASASPSAPAGAVPEVTPSPTSEASPTAPAAAPAAPVASDAPVTPVAPVAPVAPAPAAPPAASPVAPAEPSAPVGGRESAAPVGQPQCRATDLTVVDADTLVLEQAVHEVFVVRTAGADCQLEGYPAVTLTDAAGAPLPVTVTPGGNGLAARPAPVTLSRATSLSFVLSTPRDGTCVDAAGAAVTLPGTTTALRTATTLPVCAGTVGVSPLLRRTDEE